MNQILPSLLKIKKFTFIIFLLVTNIQIFSQAIIYQHNFGTTAFTSHPYTILPSILDPNLLSSSWSNSTNSWTTFAGSSGQAIALSNSSGTPTITLTVNIASGYAVTLDSFRFWRVRSTTGAQNWTMTVNGISVGSGTNPTTGASTGSLAVSSIVKNQTSLVVVIALSGASGAGTFRLDDFTLIGSVSPTANPTVSFNKTFSSVLENVSSIPVAVDMSNYSSPVSVSFAYSGSAILNTDYTVSASSLSFASSTSKNITFSPINNATFNGDKTIIIDMTLNSGTAFLGTSQHVLTITDDEVNPAKVIGFDSISKWIAGVGTAFTSYSSGHKYVSDSWTFYSSAGLRQTGVAQDGFAGALGNYSFRVKDSFVNYWYAQCNDSITVSNFGFKHRRWDGVPNPTISVDYSIDSGLTWINTLSSYTYSSSAWNFYSFKIINPITTLPNKFIVRISKGSNFERIMIDDFQFERGAPGCFPNIISSTSSNLLPICIENGWTYYGNNNGRYFAINKGNTGLTGEMLNLDIQNTIPINTSTNGINKEHASYLMKSSWNVNGTIPSGSVSIRFFYDIADTQDVVNSRNNDFNAMANPSSGYNPTTFAIKTPFEWFKTVGLPYDASWRSGIIGNIFPSSHIKLTPIYGTQNGANYVEFSGITSFSGGTGGAGYGPLGSGSAIGLPVTWASFEVKSIEQGNELVWKTASEKNTDYYQVEYSYDAKHWIETGSKIIAAGNSIDLKSYIAVHNDFSSYVYYRIKQVDIDSRIDYSIIKVAKRTHLNPFTINVYPTHITNNESLNIKITSIDKSEVQIKIIDLFGKVVMSNAIFPTNDFVFEQFDINHLPSGIYHLEIRNGQGREALKIVK